MSEKQKLIIQYLQKVGEATTIEIMDNIPFECHNNNLKRIDSILNRMVKDKLIMRIKKGSFRIFNKSDYKPEPKTLF